MKEYKWVDRAVSQLDPEVDYEKIISLTANYKLDEFIMNIAYAINFMNVVQAAHGAETLVHTRKVMEQQQARFDDSLDFLWAWYILGPSHEDVKASVARLNKIHGYVSRQLPGNFSRNEDFVQPLCLMALFEHRLRLKLGLPGMPEHMQVAFHHWLRDLAKLFATETGVIEDFPTDFAGIIAFAEKFESQSFQPTDAGNIVAEAFIEQFCVRWFPRPLRRIGRTIILVFTPPKVRYVHGLESPGPISAALVKWVFRVLIRAQESLLPDPKTPVLERMSRKRQLSPTLRKVLQAHWRDVSPIRVAPEADGSLAARPVTGCPFGFLRKP